MSFDYDTAFQRNVGILDAYDIETIRNTRVGIAGLGGCGSNHLLALVRMGFEKFAIADLDIFDYPNFNRQAGANIHTVGHSKVSVMSKMARAINPNCDIIEFSEGLTDASIPAFSEVCDIGINAIDWFQVDLYQPFHDAFHERGKYSLVGGVPFSIGAAITVIGPETPSFESIFGFNDLPETASRLHRFVEVMASCGFAQRYLPPDVNQLRDPVEDTRISSLSPGLYLATALACTELVTIIKAWSSRTRAKGAHDRAIDESAIVTLAPLRRPTLAPDVLQIDLFEQVLERSSVRVVV